MELNVAIVLVVGVAFLSIVAMKIFKSWNTTESQKIVLDAQSQQAQVILQQEITHLKNSNRSFQYKIRKIREGYDLDLDDIEIDETENDEFKLSEIATSIYPKLPDSIAKLIDKEEFQNAIVKTVEKKPEILDLFMNKFLGKGTSSDQGSSSNTPKLIEHYN